MMVIFILSAQVATDSVQTSTNVIQIVVEFLQKVFPKSNITLENMHYLIRKGAHFSEYFILGALTMNASRKCILVRYRGFIISVVICVIYAISDEFHQIFVSGRAPAIIDVLIDTCGAIFGIIIFIVFLKIISRCKKSNKEVPVKC